MCTLTSLYSIDQFHFQKQRLFLIMVRFRVLFRSEKYHQGKEFGGFVSKCNSKDCRLKFLLLFLYNFDKLLAFDKIFNPSMYFSSGFYQWFFNFLYLDVVKLNVYWTCVFTYWTLFKWKVHAPFVRVSQTAGCFDAAENSRYKDSQSSALLSKIRYA